MALGMGIVFAALIIIMFVIMALERLFREGEPPATSEVASAVPVTGVPAGEPTSSPALAEPSEAKQAGAEAEIAAAVAMAFARARAQATYTTNTAQVPGALDNVEDDRWDWVWDEGVDDYGTTRGSQYAAI
jgi:hypothetical protein